MFSANSASASSTRSQLLVALALELLDAEHAPAQELAPAAQDDAVGDGDPVAVGKQLEGIDVLDVDQPHPRLDQQQRPGVGIAAVGGGRGVDHDAHAGRDQLLGGDAVDVDVVDDGDVAGNEAFDQVLGAVAEAHPAFDRLDRRRPVAAREQSGKATATGGCHRSRLSALASGSNGL